MLSRLGVLISGSGTNLQSIINSIKKGSLKGEIGVVISNREDAYGLIRAKNENIPSFVVSHKIFKSREEHEKEIVKILKNHGVDVVVLAGYMRLITPFFISHYPEKILNIHPALLPSFKGVDAQKQAVEYGVKIAGATVHMVDENMDSGPIIIQGAICVSEDDTRDRLAEKILKVEHRIFPQAISWLIEGRIGVQGDKTVLKIDPSKKSADISDLMPCVINPPLENGF